MCFGNFTVLQPQRSTKERSLLNRLIKLLLFLNAAKLIAISLGYWLFGLANLRMYLIEFLFFEENYQRLFDWGICILHVGFYQCFSYWTTLDSNIEALESFRFVYTSKLQEPVKDLRRFYWKRYRLTNEMTDRFLAIYRFFCFISQPTIVAYAIAVFLILSRCVYHSFLSVDLAYFSSLGLLFFAATFGSYLLLDLFAVPRIILVYLSAEFLIFRVKAINRLLRRCKKQSPGISRFEEQMCLFKVLNHTNDFFRQFKQIISVLDLSFSKMLLGFFTIIFVAPYFLIFAENYVGMKLLLSVTVITIFTLLVLISIYNDRLRRQVSCF